MASASQPTLTPDFARTCRDMFLGRIEHELATTKRVIAAIPEDKKTYKPHPNSRSAWELATHIASSEVWFVNSIADRNFNFTGEPPAPADTVDGLVDWYDKAQRQAVARVRAMPVEQLLTPVDFFGIMKSAAVLYLQFSQDHTVHHRGQLSVYLRPMGAKVPDIYGGSFDEPFQG